MLGIHGHTLAVAQEGAEALQGVPQPLARTDVTDVGFCCFCPCHVGELLLWLKIHPQGVLWKSVWSLECFGS